MVQSFIPLVGRGHILMTTRTQALGRIAQRTDVEKMSQETGALFLLRRASIIPLSALLNVVTDEEFMRAFQIVEMTDGLPLALDQAGAYIRETTLHLLCSQG